MKDYHKQIAEWLANDANIHECTTGHRGGVVTVKAEKLVEELFFADDNTSAHEAIMEEMHGEIWGARCNYLGGGVRGAVEAICPGVSRLRNEIDASVHEDLHEFANAFAAAIKDKYKSIEDEEGLNDEGDDDAPNWDAMATNSARTTGMTSAY